MHRIGIDIRKEISTDPNRYIRLGLLIVAIFFGGFGAWAAIGKMEGAIIAPGTIKVEQNRKDVQHLEGGIVQKIWVRDGARVTKGQKLLTLESARVNANVEILSGQRQAALAIKARLEAEKGQEEKITWPTDLLKDKNNPEVAELMQAEKEIFTSQRDSFDSQKKLYHTQIEQIKQQIIGLQEQTKSEDNIIDALKEELQAKQELLDERYLEKPPVLALKRELAGHEGRRSGLQGSIAQNQERITEIHVRLNDLDTKYIQRATAQLSQVQAHLFDLEDKLLPLIDTKHRLDVLSPASGVVVDMQVFSEGEVIRPGEVLMQIVPEEEPLIIECNAQTRDIAKVYLDQPARIELNAYNVREVLPVKGRVVYVSADSVMIRTPYGEHPVYKVHVEIDRGEVEAQGLSLTPGMPVTVFLSRGERTFLDYIMEPIIENFRRALRE